MKKLVSFDIDGTLLHQESVQVYCKGLMNRECVEIHICTKRYGENVLTDTELPDNEWWFAKGNANWLEVYELADKLGIKRENIHFCNMRDKSIFFKDNQDFIWHLDDDSWEIKDINDSNIGVIAISVKDENWEEQCNKLINI